MTSKQASNQANKGKQGFASMDPEKQREIASKGGRTSHKGDEPNAKVNDTDDAVTDEITDEIEDEGEELDELLDILDEAELTDLDPEEGIEIIDQWHEILNDSGDAELKEIGKSLKQLKKVLSSSKSKPEAIAEALCQLGEQTNEYANNAQRGYKTKLHKLGKSLNKAGKSLEQQEAE
ncbi:KGG domain-containing protein [Leptolyngbya sp. NK1-12]|uniref:KGG domain-containing protein n=1 Tax=Leptolyngbya sp. NK1-12 TaxID=2547451 RepID=UPI00292CC649|nr:KGG domain-containing protein [Leptolyngbya sp. NK1-12]